METALLFNFDTRQYPEAQMVQDLALATGKTEATGLLLNVRVGPRLRPRLRVFMLCLTVTLPCVLPETLTSSSPVSTHSRDSFATSESQAPPASTRCLRLLLFGLIRRPENGR